MFDVINTFETKNHTSDKNTKFNNTLELKRHNDVLNSEDCDEYVMMMIVVMMLILTVVKIMIMVMIRRVR